jgi:hypothetical protein
MAETLHSLMQVRSTFQTLGLLSNSAPAIHPIVLKIGGLPRPGLTPSGMQPSTATCMDGSAVKPPIDKARCLDPLHDTTPDLGE